MYSETKWIFFLSLGVRGKWHQTRSEGDVGGNRYPGGGFALVSANFHLVLVPMIFFQKRPRYTRNTRYTWIECCKCDESNRGPSPF